jgi:DNA (cytosine-5)-methyltransferase 1
VELFAGIGGFRVGLDALGGRCVFASELQERARAIYRLNFEDRLRGSGREAEATAVLAGDIREVPAAQVPAHDLLVGGFPCQVRLW